MLSNLAGNFRTERCAHRLRGSSGSHADSIASPGTCVSWPTSTGSKRWAERFHGGGSLVASLGDRYPLIIFHGDVGTGKTATAEAAADALARALDTEGFLLRLSTRVRGIGHVGEMSTLISDAFTEAVRLLGAGVLSR